MLKKKREWLWGALLLAALSGCGGGEQTPGGTGGTDGNAGSSGSGGTPEAPTTPTSPASGASSPTGGGTGSGGTTSPGGTVSAQHPKVLVNNAATLQRLKQLLQDKAPAAVRFQAYVDSELAKPGGNYAFQTWFAALMYQVTGDTKYAAFAVARTDAFVASEEASIAAGQRPTVSNDSYLDVGGLVGNVALVYDWCHTSLSPAQRQRWIAYMNQSVANVWSPDKASWGGKPFAWSGWSVNDPANNYYYSFLKATMLVGLATAGENDQALAWRNQFRNTKIAGQLVPVFEKELAGGGSREGTGYGVAMKGLFQLYDWWERSTGERISTLTTHALESQAWMLHAIVPSLDYLAAIGDQARDSSVALFDYHREYLLSLISLFPQERISGAAKSVLDVSALPKMYHGFEAFADYLYAPANLPAAQPGDLSTAYWAPGTGQLFMRASWTDKKAAYSSFTCGPYTQGHAHRDQGAFQLYRGAWLAPTSNVFSHSGIQNGEEHNNLVRIVQNGVTVQQGMNTACELKALADNAHFTYGHARITPVYAGKAAVSKVEREYLFIKPSTFVVFDRVASKPGTQRVWTLNMMGAANVNGDRLTVTAANANTLDVYRVAPAGLTYQVTSPALSDSNGDKWLKQPQRVEVTDTAGERSLFLNVMGTNGAVSSVARSDAAGSTGAQITLADGRRVLVRFANGDDGLTGGTVEILSASGGTQFSGPLPKTVVAPPVFAH